MKKILRLGALIAVFGVLSLSGLTAYAGPIGPTPAGGKPIGPTPAADTTQSPSGGLTNPLNGIDSLPEFMDKILQAVVQLGSIVLLFAIIYVGFKFVTAQGNEEEIRSARSALMWTVIGGLILLGAQTIGLVISTTVNSLK